MISHVPRRLARRLPAALALVAALTAPAAAAPATAIARVDEVIDAPRALFGKTAAEIELRLGPPLAARSGTTGTWRDPAASRPIRFLTYPGLVLGVQAATGLRRVRITSAVYPLPYGLGVGVSRRMVEEALGEPQEVTEMRVLYLYSDGFPETVEFHFRDGRVHRIDWSYWVE